MSDLPDMVKVEVEVELQAEVVHAIQDLASTSKDFGTAAKDIGTTSKDFGTAAKDIGTTSKDFGLGFKILAVGSVVTMMTVAFGYTYRYYNFEHKSTVHNSLTH